MHGMKHHPCLLFIFQLFAPCDKFDCIKPKSFFNGSHKENIAINKFGAITQKNILQPIAEFL